MVSISQRLFGTWQLRLRQSHGGALGSCQPQFQQVGKLNGFAESTTAPGESAMRAATGVGVEKAAIIALGRIDGDSGFRKEDLSRRS